MSNVSKQTCNFLSGGVEPYGTMQDVLLWALTHSPRKDMFKVTNLFSSSYRLKRL